MGIMKNCSNTSLSSQPSPQPSNQPFGKLPTRHTYAPTQQSSRTPTHHPTSKPSRSLFSQPTKHRPSPTFQSAIPPTSDQTFARAAGRPIAKADERQSADCWIAPSGGAAGRQSGRSARVGGRCPESAEHASFVRTIQATDLDAIPTAYKVAHISAFRHRHNLPRSQTYSAHATATLHPSTHLGT